MLRPLVKLTRGEQIEDFRRAITDFYVCHIHKKVSLLSNGMLFLSAYFRCYLLSCKNVAVV